MNLYNILITFFLNLRIYLLRYRMISSGKSKGLNHPLTVKYSQDLDRYSFKYIPLLKRGEKEAFVKLFPLHFAVISII
ncbi:hypothetical protein WQ54_15665 [Bacillus sp. SA1-12]|uniref:aspartyl-phosphate phosphatase Spo0E family protein n=1 Tax=Bacillus sp. SA1-12 TaxID=1455638 RepID=UPI0006272561|nr:aspartyl-phosphate phosphatase Spo0E family protein [Bacillus sp. SA1-12]KKI91262.1 hypothetical protein WQ54_15665 [Bacillus sp. SA1-12]